MSEPNPAGSEAPADIRLRSIGIVRTPHKVAEKTPIQPIYATGVPGKAEIFPEFAPGLRDLDGFSHIHLIYFLHRAEAAKLIVQPFLEDVERGVFATRAPRRPNPIGLSVVRLIRREGNILHLEDVDLLDGTPLLDIKPYVAAMDCRPDARSGWFDGIDEEAAERRGRRLDARK